MLVALYKTKKNLKESIGRLLNYQETSIFGVEYLPDGRLTVVGPTATSRKWFANVTLHDGIISKVE